MLTQGRLCMRHAVTQWSLRPVAHGAARAVKQSRAAACCDLDRWQPYLKRATRAAEALELKGRAITTAGVVVANGHGSLAALLCVWRGSDKSNDTFFSQHCDVIQSQTACCVLPSSPYQLGRVR